MGKAFAVVLAFMFAGAASAAPLNLLLVTADDMNADSTGFMGSKLGATPNLDAFAATAFRFEQCHVSAPICQPSRSAFMTGRVPHRNGALSFHPIRTDVPTLVEILRDRGYFTAAINKIEHMAPKTKFLVSSVDILPTILEILGIPAPAGLDGQSWLPLVRGEKQAGRDHVVTHVNTVSSGASFVQRCVRTPTHSYIWHAWSDGTTKFRVEAMSGLSFNALAEAGTMDSRIAARVRQFQIGEPEMFFDLTRDPDERNNLIRDPSRRGEVERLRKLLLAHMERTQDPQQAAFGTLLRSVANR